MSEELFKENARDTKKVDCNNSNVSDGVEPEKGQLPNGLDVRSPDDIEESTPMELGDNENDNSKQIEKVITRVIEQKFIGPIPPPNIISGYEDVIPGSADRILSMAERQSSHRQQMELREIKAESRDSLLGVIFAFMLGAGCILACVVMVISVPSAAGAICGSVIGVTGIGSIVTGFLRNTRGKK